MVELRAEAFEAGEVDIVRRRFVVAAEDASVRDSAVAGKENIRVGT